MKNQTNAFLDWSEVYDAGPAQAGGKGWNLARLHRYGFPVPAGGVLSARSCRQFLEHNRMEAELQAYAAATGPFEPSAEDRQQSSDRIQLLFQSARIPPALEEEIDARLEQWNLSGTPLAVRSSAAVEDSPTASFAGIHDSFLNVTGRGDLFSALKLCWASMWGSRAAAYRSRMGIPGAPTPPPVVIMEMVDAAVSGVAFSCHPGSGREDQVYISANFGLGESVVGGSADPDEYTVQTGFHSLQQSVARVRVGRKETRSIPLEGGGTSLVPYPEGPHGQALTDEQILLLARLVRRVYCALGDAEVHQDVEWVFDGEVFRLVQARPVTAVPRYTYPDLRDQPTIWSNANFRDTLPDVIPPLTWTNMTDALDTVLKSVMKASGYTPLPGVSRKRLYLGRGYFNASVIQWESYDCFGSPPHRVNALIGGHHPAIGVPETGSWRSLPGRVRRNLAFMRAAGKVRRNVDKQFRQLSGRMRGAGGRDLKILSDGELLEFWSALENAFRGYPDVHFALVGSAANYLMLILLLERYFPGKSNSMANSLLAGSEITTSARHGYRLAELAETAAGDPDARAFLNRTDANTRSWHEDLPGSSPFRRAFSSFLQEFGHRGVTEWDLRKPRWREDPAWLFAVIRSHLSAMGEGGVKNLRQRQRDISAQAMRQAALRVPFYLRRYLKGLVRGAGREAVQREMARSTLSRVVGIGRITALECGRRFVHRGLIGEIDDIFFLTWQDVQAVLIGESGGGGLKPLVADRRLRHEELEKLTPPDFLEEDAPHRAGTTGAGGGDVLAGLGAAAGRAAGPARLIHHPDEQHRLGNGDVLVAPATDPAWTPLFLRASGLVMETGGIISHGAIVAREYGIPAVINVPGAMGLITDGTLVTVDGDEGRVYLDQEPSHGT